jgi:hypothetical protein
MSSKRVACCAGVEVLNFYLLASQLAGGMRRTAVGALRGHRPRSPSSWATSTASRLRPRLSKLPMARMMACSRVIESGEASALKSFAGSNRTPALNRDFRKKIGLSKRLSQRSPNLGNPVPAHSDHQGDQRAGTRQRGEHLLPLAGQVG